MPMDMDVGYNLILGWDWILSHNLQHLYQMPAGQVELRSDLAQLQLALLPAAAHPPLTTISTVIGHGEQCRLHSRLSASRLRAWGYRPGRARADIR